MFSNVGYDFLFPKLHAIWAESLHDSGLSALVQHGGEQALNRRLQSLKIDPVQRSEVQRSLTVRFLENLKDISELLDEKTGLYYQSFVLRYYLENVKVLLHHHFFPETRSEIDYLLIHSDSLPKINLDAALNARNINQLVRSFPKTVFSDQLLKIIVELEDTENLFLAESRIEKLFFNEQRERAAELPRKIRTDSLQLVTEVIDFINLITVMRNAEIYRLDSATVGELLISGGKDLPVKKLEELSQLEQREKIAESLPGPMRRRLAEHFDKPLSYIETVLWRMIYKEAYKAFRDFDNPTRSVGVFPFLKYFELLNTGRLYEGFHFDVPSTELQLMMIGVS